MVEAFFVAAAVVVAAVAAWETAMVVAVVVVVAAVPGFHTQTSERTLGVDHHHRRRQHPVPFVVATWHFVVQRTCRPC